MTVQRYRIYELSARAVMSYATEEKGIYKYNLDAAAVDHCLVSSAAHEQDSNALFFQIMCVLYGDSYAEPNDGTLIPDLSDAIFYMDFDHVFDRSAASKKTAAPPGKGPGHVPPRGRGTGLRLRPVSVCGLRALRQYEPSGAAVLHPGGSL